MKANLITVFDDECLRPQRYWAKNDIVVVSTGEEMPPKALAAVVHEIPVVRVRSLCDKTQHLQASQEVTIYLDAEHCGEPERERTL